MMMKGPPYKIFFSLFFGLVLYACIEPFAIETSSSFGSTLVVEATITNEEKQQIVLLSRTYNLNESSTNPESNAEVKVVDDTGNEFSFTEAAAGTYVSIQSFAARTGVGYSLSVNTSDGNSYLSDPEPTPAKVSISNLYAVRETNDLGEEGVSILLDNESPAGEPKYFRYEYEETYKIVAPVWTPLEYEIISDVLIDLENGYKVGLKEESEPRQVCYKTETSKDLIQTSSINLTENVISRFPVRFLSRNDYRIFPRYSILLRQYVQNADAYFYDQKLADFSSSESVFSEIQAGFLAGNIHSINNREEKVIGYFEVAAVDNKRVFFNYKDLFPGEAPPRFIANCNLVLDIPLYSTRFHAFINEEGKFICDAACESPLINAIKSGDIVYYDTKPGYENANSASLVSVAPFLSIAAICGDCRVLGSNIKPDFWVDE